MPNWCRNRVTAYAKNGNEQDITKIIEIFESKDSVFGKIIPSPDWDNTPNKNGELPIRKEHKNPKMLDVSVKNNNIAMTHVHHTNIFQHKNKDIQEFVRKSKVRKSGCHIFFLYSFGK